MSTPQKRLVVIGGGAAGFFCAINAARMQPALQVTLLEKTGKLLSKVRVSGGGRCNVTHACFDISVMANRYPRGANFVRKAFHRFFTNDTIEWFAQRGVKLKTEPDGRMFPQTNTSETIVNCLMDEAKRYGVTIRLHCEAIGIRNTRSTNGDDHTKTALELNLNTGETLVADFVCVACGGYPKAAMFDWLAGTGHQFEPPVPSLFTFNLPAHPITALMGVSMEPVQVKIAGTKLLSEGPLLITHWGTSGPATLKLSAWGARELAARDYRFTALVNWLPAHPEATMPAFFEQMRQERGKQALGNKNAFGLPARLWDFLLREAGADPAGRWADLPANTRNRLIGLLCRQELAVEGKTTFKEEFVTAGGIKLSEIDPQTMMSRRVPGLFFAGEIMDVDGITGGYNFQHAWTSGWIAAESISRA